MNAIGERTTLVTCHGNADFDAFSAMLAARHLYPNPALLFPGSQENELKKVYAEIDKDYFGFIENDKLDNFNFDTIVIVDTRQRSRLQHVTKLIERHDTEIIVWDHHPDTSDDIEATVCHRQDTGAVTSQLVAQLALHNISLPAYEATLLGLGIYSDTGSFTYTSTTRQDFEAAAWLLQQGMNVASISDMAAHRLTSLHIQILNNLIEAAKVYKVGNSSIVITEVSLEHYLGDFANIVHQLMEMEKFPVLFAIGFMGDRVQLVARSRDDNINVGDICKLFNGGGHAYAASASIRAKTTSEIRDTILYSIHRNLHSGKTARDYMSSPAIGVEGSTSLQKADELMLHFSLKSIPVFREGTRQCCGLLDSETASKANAHGLGHARTADYMQRNFKSLGPEATLNELATVIMDFRQRIVPIVENEIVCGVVTRTDLLNIFAEDLTAEKKKNPPQERNIAKLIHDRFPKDIVRLLQLIGETAEKLHMPVYAVGGFVRDLLLEYPNHDIDLVVEGNGIALARELASQLGGRVNEHKKFLTSVIIFKNAQGIEQRIDVATARLEYYEEPAALPNVEQSSIKLDCSRRDFTINALAVRLDGAYFGKLKDFFDGQRDIKNKLVRVLHTLSFVEDPTRCLRAVRFEQRYQFTLGINTEKLIRNAVALKLMDKLSRQRIFNEYSHICDERNPHACLERLHELGILQEITQKTLLSQKNIGLLAKTTELLHWFKLVAEDTLERYLVYFLAMTNGLKYVDAEQVYLRLGLPPKQKKTVLQQREHVRHILGTLKGKVKDQLGTSAFCDMLRPLPVEHIIHLMTLVDDDDTKKLAMYITQWRKEDIAIDGYTLRELGLEEGPAYRHILKSILDAKLDGLAPDMRSQLDLARKLIANGKVAKH